MQTFNDAFIFLTRIRTCNPESGRSVGPHDLVLDEPRLQLDDRLGRAEVAARSRSEGGVLEVKLLQGAVVLKGREQGKVIKGCSGVSDTV